LTNTANPLRQPDATPFGERSASLRAWRWSVVGERTIYFGHQSVGAGVSAGVESLAKDYRLPLRVVNTREPESIVGPAFVHFQVGQHRDYASKNAAMLRLLESEKRARNPLVLLKYCHGDIASADDCAGLFAAYRDAVDTIQFEHPDVTLVHSTIPLTLVDGGLKARTSDYLGRTRDRQPAMARHHYNELIRAEFGSSEPVFDIAGIQATRPDGSRAGFTAAGTTIETLAPDNTDDAGELTMQCRAAAAAALLDLLSGVIEAAQ
jgi:hypothetical protein